MPTLPAPTVSDCLALPLLVGLDLPFAERLLTRLVRGPEARWMVWRDDRAVLAGVVVDTTASAHNVADLYPVAGDHQRLEFEGDAVGAACGMAGEGQHGERGPCEAGLHG